MSALRERNAVPDDLRTAKRTELRYHAVVMASRKRTPDQTEADVLIASRRRCALCYGLFGVLDQKRGQIAHADRDPSNAEFDNLAFLCLPHHDEYDSKTSQSKRFTPAELIAYRKRLYDRVGQGLDDTTPASALVQSQTTAVPPATSARHEACIELERDAGLLVERLTSHARLESDEQVLWATIKRFEHNIGLVRRDQRLTQAVRDFAHQCKIILSEKGMFQRPPHERLAELAELRGHFDTFVREVDRLDADGQQAALSSAAVTHAETAPFFTLVSGSFSAGVMDFHVRNDGQAVTVLIFETKTGGAHIRQWYPTSLPPGEVLRATVDLDHPEPTTCMFRLRLRDRIGRERTFELRLDHASSPQRFDFIEVRDAGTAEDVLPDYERAVMTYLGEHRIAAEERLAEHLEHLGFNKIAYTIAVEALQRKHLIELMPSLDPIPAHILYHLTKAGMRWLLEHPEQLIVRRSAG